MGNRRVDRHLGHDVDPECGLDVGYAERSAVLAKQHDPGRPRSSDRPKEREVAGSNDEERRVGNREDGCPSAGLAEHRRAEVHHHRPWLIGEVGGKIVPSSTSGRPEPNGSGREDRQVGASLDLQRSQGIGADRRIGGQPRPHALADRPELRTEHRQRVTGQIDEQRVTGSLRLHDGERRSDDRGATASLDRPAHRDHDAPFANRVIDHDGQRRPGDDGSVQQGEGAMSPYRSSALVHRGQPRLVGRAWLADRTSLTRRPIGVTATGRTPARLDSRDLCHTSAPVTSVTSQPTTMTDSATTTDHVLALTGVEVACGGVIQVLRGVSLEVSRGAIVAILGANGAGKTTALRAISGLLPYQNGKIIGGSIHFDGAETTGTDTAALVRRGIAQVMEGRRIFAEISVDDNLKTGAYTRKDKAGIVESYERVMDLFQRLREQHKQIAGYMSGGEYYTPPEAVKAYAETKNSTVLCGMVYGTPMAQALEKSLNEDNLIGSPISLDAAWVKSSAYLPIGATYQGQAINLLDWYSKEGGGAGTTICSLALANNAYGNAGEEGFDYDAVVLTISGEAQIPGLLAETAKLDYFPQFLALAPSFASGTVVPANSAQYAKQVIVAADGAQWGVETTAGMKQHMADLRKYLPQEIGIPNPATECGYAQAITVVALLEKAVAKGDLRKVGIVGRWPNSGPSIPSGSTQLELRRPGHSGGTEHQQHLQGRHHRLRRSRPAESQPRLERGLQVASRPVTTVTRETSKRQ